MAHTPPNMSASLHLNDTVPKAEVHEREGIIWFKIETEQTFPNPGFAVFATPSQIERIITQLQSGLDHLNTKLGGE